MRRYENPERFLESFSAAARQIKDPESRQKINGNLTACDPENDENFEEDYDEEQDEECSETEHDEGVQLTLIWKKEEQFYERKHNENRGCRT